MKNSIIIVILFFTGLSMRFHANAQSLDSLLFMAVESNLELKAIDLEYKSILEKRDQVGQLPNPQMSLGVPVLLPDVRLGPQVMMIGASQMFPWFGTLKSKEDVVVSMSKVKYEELAILKLELFYQIKSAYYQLYFLNQKTIVITENIRIYQSLENITLSKVEAGQASMADVLRIQSKLLELEQQFLMIDNQKISFESRITEITKRPISQTTKFDGLLIHPILVLNMESLREKIESNHPLINQVNYEIETSKKMLLENSFTNKPSIGIGVDYSIFVKGTDINPMNKGNDMFTPRLTLSLPLYRKSYRAKINEENFIQESLEVRKESLADKMIGILYRYRSEYENGRLELELYELQIEKIRLAYDLILTDFISSGLGFEELLLVQNQLQDLQLGIYQAELKKNDAQANIERIINF